MHSLADFLNHGLLPFVGREAELHRIIEFWRGVFQATELRLMLVIGEAGIGKSRLLDQALRQITGSGGSVVHVKLYPEASQSLLAMVARSLWHPDAARFFLREEPEAKLGPVGETMQRLARLRPTVLVLEDLHLLGKEGLPDLMRLLKMVADEAIAVVALARPVELESRGVLEAYVVEEMVLEGLSDGECAGVWEQVSGAVMGAEGKAMLHEVTAGNPLALRSALRSALKGGDRAGGSSIRPSEGGASFTRTLKQSVGLLAEGMTAHLNAEELNGAKRLATLGEIFAREAAELMLDNSESLLEALLFKGIIATAIAPPNPLPAVASEHAPLAFTHTLLHHQLIDVPLFDADALVRVVAGSPLYSITPFLLLAERAWTVPMLDLETIRQAFDRTMAVELGFATSAYWRNAEQTWRTSACLLSSRLGMWEQEQWDRMLVKLIYHKTSMVRSAPLEIREYWLEYLRAITKELSSNELAEGYLYVLTYSDLWYSPFKPDITRKLWEESEKLVADRPHLRSTIAYSDYIVAAGINAYTNADKWMQRRIEKHVNELFVFRILADTTRAILEYKINPLFLSLFEDRAELQIRLAQVAEFERTVKKSDLRVWNYCINLLAEVAHLDMLRRVCKECFPAMYEQGLVDLAVYTIVREQRVLAGQSETFASTLSAFETAFADIPEWRRPQVEKALALHLIDAALLRDEPDQAEMLVQRFNVISADLRPGQWVALSLCSPDPCSVLVAGKAVRAKQEELMPLIDLATGVRDAADYTDIITVLGAEVLRIDDILKIIVAADLVELESSHEIPAAEILRSHVAAMLERGLQWLAEPERGLYVYMRTILRRGMKCLGDEACTFWAKKIEDIEKAHHGKQQMADDKRLRLSMLGRITLRFPDGREQRFQGARARMVLAMMVINRMMRAPLSSEEFCRLATGNDTVDVESARDIVKTTVHRLREAIGHDAILTTGPTPELNPALVEVDILEAHRLLHLSIEAMRRAAPMQAKSALLEAMNIADGEVPFPSLYDNLVEAMREEFEGVMRTTVIDLTRSLTRDGAFEDASEVLRFANDVIPGDEELMELLSVSLLHAGHHVEAERMQRKLVDA